MTMALQLSRFQKVKKRISRWFFKWSESANYRVGVTTHPFYLEYENSSFFLYYKSHKIIEIPKAECQFQTEPPLHTLIWRMETASLDYLGLHLSFDVEALQTLEIFGIGEQQILWKPLESSRIN